MICTGSGARRSMREAKFGMPTRAINSMRFKLRASFPKRLQGAPEPVWTLLSIAEKAIVNAHLYSRPGAKSVLPCKGASVESSVLTNQ